MRGHDRAGALFLAFRKKKPLPTRAGTAVAELLRRGLEKSGLVNPLNIKPEFCVVVDVFRDRVYLAPRGRKILGYEIESACREIAILWPSVGRRAA